MASKDTPICVDTVLVHNYPMKESSSRERSMVQLIVAGVDRNTFTVKFHSGLKNVVPFAVLGGGALAAALWLGWKIGELTAVL